MSHVSFAALVRSKKVRRIEIPMIQRDYAQGRPAAHSVREAFLDVLRDAVLGVRSVHLDFVYGEIIDGKLIPLDGQQRLTALFLLHWYVAARSGIGASEFANSVPELTYETRHSSRVFCQKLAAERPTFPLGPGDHALSRWIVDRSWFVRAWRHDPTISSMLVVLDSIDARLRAADCGEIWKRLVGEGSSPITFDFLPLETLGLTDDLYVKMNSRGKPLTEFENFKASLEEMIRSVSKDLHRDAARKLDNQWCDVFWRLRGGANVIDAKFSSYFSFATDVIAHRNGGVARPTDPLLTRARSVFGPERANAAENIKSLMTMFDVWTGRDVSQFFRDVFTNADHQPGKVAIFSDVQLFDACCSEYAARNFSLPRLLLLYGVIHHLATQSSEFDARIRTLRNLVLNSPNELRQETLPVAVDGASYLIDSGTNMVLTAFNRRQTGEETAKAKFVSENPDVTATLQRLEDHPLLQGCLASFDLDASKLADRARAFEELFPPTGGGPSELMMGALLAKGNYARDTRGRFQFGTSSRAVWRELLTGADVSAIKGPLGSLLDEVGPPTEGTIEKRLQRIIAAYLADQEAKTEFDWRYYFVRYEAMRRALRGIYASATATMGFNVCMLDTTRLTGWYRDPYLFAVYGLAGRPANVREPKFKHGYPADARWLEIPSTGAGMRCVEAGFVVRGVTGADFANEFGVDENGVVRVPHKMQAGVRFDSVDRVRLGVEILKKLVA